MSIKTKFAALALPPSPSRHDRFHQPGAGQAAALGYGAGLVGAAVIGTAIAALARLLRLRLSPLRWCASSTPSATTSAASAPALLIPEADLVTA